MSAASGDGIRFVAEADAVLAMVAIALAGDACPGATAEHRPDDIHPAEWLEAEVITDPARRLEWLAGRRAAKLALRTFLGEQGFDPAVYAIRSRDRFGRPARPTLWSRGRPVALDVSVSHGASLAAGIVSPSRRVGIDVVDVTRSADPDPWTWSAREAAYKVGPGEEAFDPELWQVERVARRAVGTATHRARPQRALRVRWIDDVAGAGVVAVCWDAAAAERDGAERDGTGERSAA